MKIIKPSIDEIIFHIPEGYTVETWLEKCGRTCYLSSDKITEDSASRFVKMIRDRGHHAMLEHAMVSVRITTDRAIANEMVRHRLASFAQESTRYCNYTKNKFENNITIVEQPTLNIDLPKEELESSEAIKVWTAAMETAEYFYQKLIKLGIKPEIARSVLPLGLKTEIVLSANLREFRHIIKLRCASSAHPAIRSIFLEILQKLYDRIPSVYEDLYKEFLEDKNEETKM
jgi:thymidylate synthase (FAD)